MAAYVKLSAKAASTTNSATREILEIPFRKSHSVDLSSAIRSYISKHYDQSPSTFADDLRAVDQLREEAINVREPHSSGVNKLQRYIAQLQYLSGKFPIDIGVEFPWYPAIGYNTQNPILQNNLRYELANILFNLAALYTQLAFSLNRTTPEGLKQAAGYGMYAAGTFAYLRTDIIPDMRGTPPEDMDAATLESLEQLCLAQAQEAYWLKAVKDGMRDGTVAKLAAKVSDYYNAAGDLAIKSDAVSTEWIHHLQAKHHHFAAAAQYRMSRDCLEKRKYGEEVARLRDSIKCVDEALKEQRWVNRTVQGDLQGLKQRVTEELKRAEKDNDVIYLLPVPSKSELEILPRANMVSAKAPKEVSDGISMLGPKQPFGNPLFEKLVPYAVHQAASIYADRRDRLVNQSIIADIDAMTDQIRDTLQSLNLPGSLQALEKPLGLPPSLVSKAEELRQHDALSRLKQSVDDTHRIKTNDLSVYQEGLSLLAAERQEDEAARERFGTERWTRPPSRIALAKLYQQSTELQNYLNSAASSDNLVQGKIRDHEHILRIMQGSDHDIEAYVPSSRNVTLSHELESAAANLRTILNETSRLENRRKRKIEALKSKASNDDINAALLAEAARIEREYPMQPISAAQFEPLFESRLEEYESDRKSSLAEQEEQDELLSRLRDANTAFLAARQREASSSSGTVKARERALQELDNAYLKYKEIVNNLDTGRKFYNDLAGHVNRFRDSTQKQVAARRVEKSEMEQELISGDVGRLKLEETRRELRSERARQQAADGSAITKQKQEEPMPAPKPTHPASTAGVANTRSPLPVPIGVQNGPVVGGGGNVAGGVWTPDMGIRFGGSGPPGAGSAGYPQPRRPG
jgi:programmed cell death 6-interacting protein